jgi:regulator of cell morphogenesis and NO signaling
MRVTPRPDSGPGFPSRSLAEIATSLPGATAVFRRAKLDFWRDGKVLLAEAAAAHQLDVAALTEELEAIAKAALPGGECKHPEALITLVETRYHETHRRELPELIRLARRVEAVHRGNAAAPAGLAQLLEQIAAELDCHMQKEEQILFPLMRRSGHPMIGQPIAAMLTEHDQHGRYLQALEALTGDFTPPADACSTWRALYVRTR